MDGGGIILRVGGEDEHPRAIAAVLDTSYYNSGHINLEKITRLAHGLSARGAQLWIPEQVILEWANHARGALGDFHQAGRRLQNAGLADFSPETRLPEVSEVADKIRSRCESTDNVVVLAMRGDSAIAGIRDQILGSGAGKGRPGARTGASDSSWVRDSLANAANDPRRIVFVTRNAKDVIATAGEMGHTESIVQTWGRGDDQGLLEKYFPRTPLATQPAVDALSALRIISDTLQRSYAASIDPNRPGPSAEWITVTDLAIGSVTDLWDRRDLDEMIDPYVEMEPGAKLIDVRNVEVGGTAAEVTVRYTVRLLVDLHVESRVVDEEGAVSHSFLILRKQVLLVPFAARLSDGKLRNIRQAGTAESHQGAVTFRDSYDAASWLYHEELSDWDHITVQPDPTASDGAGAPASFELRGPYGRTEAVTLTQLEMEEEWRLEFEGSRAVITAYNNLGSRAALGREDSFNVYPPVELRSSYGNEWFVSDEPYTALSSVWAFLMEEEKSRYRCGATETKTTPIPPAQGPAATDAI